MAAYITYCIRLPLALGFGIVVLVGLRIVYIGIGRRLVYRALLKRRAERAGRQMAESGLGPKS